jgi:hypothetical protein
MVARMKATYGAWRRYGVRILAGIALLLVLAFARFGTAFHS